MERRARHLGGGRHAGRPPQGDAAALRPSAQSRSRGATALPDPTTDPAGWLFDTARPGLLALYASHHPVTGDQLLTRAAEDAVQMGYGDVQLLGFMAPQAPLTGNLESHAVGMPWARRSGHVPLIG